MHLVPLRSDTLRETQYLAADLFPWEHEHQLALTATVDADARASFLAAHGLAEVRFWTLLHNSQVSGLAGLYHYAAQPKEVWLAWYGLHPDLRGHGNGAALLDWVIAEARAEQKQVLRLWTTDEDEYTKATSLYKARGFRSESWPALPGETWGTLVMSLGLDAKVPMPWAECAHNRELCGREAPQLVAA